MNKINNNIRAAFQNIQNLMIGERLVGFKELNGWIWCQKVLKFEEGYIDEYIIDDLQELLSKMVTVKED